jgi:hypothetical protein
MINKLRNIALKLGATEFGQSRVKNKRFYVIYQGKRINFGSDVGKTYIDHRDFNKMKAWYSRHKKITNKDGRVVINLKTSPSYWSARILWPPVGTQVLNRMLN